MIIAPIEVDPARERLWDVVEPPEPPAPQQEPGNLLARLRRLHIRDVGVFGIFVALFAMTLRPVVDNDLFWHLATGRYIWTTGRIPHADPFSWTAYGRAWIAHEWLTETLLYPLFVHGGYPALMLVFASVITAAFAVAYATARLLGATRPIALLVVMVGAVASDHTWGIRPQMLSLLLAALTIWTLTRAWLTGKTRLLWAVPPLLLLWVNLHGGFIFGLVIIGCYAFGYTCEALLTPKGPATALPARGDPGWQSTGTAVPEGDTHDVGAYRIRPGSRAGRAGVCDTPLQHPTAVGVALPCDPSADWSLGTSPTAQPSSRRHSLGVRALWLTFAASLGACLLNPNGVKGLIYPFTYLGNNASTRYVAEWVSPDFHQAHYQVFAALLLALIAGAALSPRRPHFVELLLALLFTYLSLSSVRNINLFSIVVAPLIAVYLSFAWRQLAQRARAAGARAFGQALPGPQGLGQQAEEPGPEGPGRRTDPEGSEWAQHALDHDQTGRRPSPPGPLVPASCHGPSGPGRQRLVEGTGRADDRPRRRPIRPGIAVLNVALAVVIAAATLIVSAPNLTARHNTAIQARRFPSGAVAYLRAHHLPGRLLNSYDWGGYLIWTVPQKKVYIDGRPDMYGDRFVDAFVRTWQAQPGWQATLRRQNVRLVLVEPSSGLGRALAGKAGWRVAFRDKVSVLYVRA